MLPVPRLTQNILWPRLAGVQYGTLHLLWFSQRLGDRPVIAFPELQAVCRLVRKKKR